MAKTKSRTITDQRIIIGILIVVILILLVIMFVTNAGREDIDRQVENSAEKIAELTVSNDELQAQVKRLELSVEDSYEKGKAEQLEGDQWEIKKLESKIADYEEAERLRAQAEDEFLNGGGEDGSSVTDRSSSAKSSSAAERSSSVKSSSVKASSVTKSSSAAKSSSSSEMGSEAGKQTPGNTGHSFTDKYGQSATFTEEEWNYLLGIWNYTGQAEEMISHHSVSELKSLLSVR